jgi:hypothetical protein
MRDFEGYQFRIPNVSRIDREILREELTRYNAAVEEPQREAGAHNELLTFVVIGGMSVLSMMSAYYFGKRHTETVELEVEMIAPDGTRKIIRLKLRKDSVEPIENQVIGQLAKQLGS